MKSALILVPVSAILLASAGPALAEKIHLRCEVTTSNYGPNTRTLMVDTDQREVVQDGVRHTVEGFPRQYRDDDGATRVVLDRVYQFDDDTVRWGTHPEELTTLSRVTGAYQNRYTSGQCTKVTGRVF